MTEPKLKRGARRYFGPEPTSGEPLIIPCICCPQRRAAALLILALGVLLAGGIVRARDAAAETIKISLLKQAGAAPLFIAQEKGYFAAEGLTAALVYFQAGQAVAVAVASGDIDFGTVGISGGLYNLAGQGALKIIAGSYREAPGFPVFAFVASNRAYAAGLKSYADLPGHVIGLTAIGSSGHYTLALIAEKLGLDLASIRVVSMQSTSNIASALGGGQIDAASQLANTAVPMVAAGNAHLIGFPGEIVPWQTAVVFTATKTANERRDTVERFLRAYRKGARLYYDAFVGPDGKRKDGPAAPDMLALIGKNLDLPVAQVAQSISYLDPDGRLDATDILHQIAWYKSQGMVKGDFDPTSVIDTRYALPLPEH